MDMSLASREVISTHLSEAKIVCDRLRIMTLFNEKPSDLRPALHLEATDVMRKQVLKGDAVAGVESLGEPR